MVEIPDIAVNRLTRCVVGVAIRGVHLSASPKSRHHFDDTAVTRGKMRPHRKKPHAPGAFLFA